MVSIEIQGLKKANQFLSSQARRTNKLIQKGLNRSAIHVQGETKMSIAGQRAEHRSVDTGRFLNSVDFQTNNRTLMAWIFSDLPYAKFLEYGTSKFRGRRHFSNTAKRQKAKVRDIIANELKLL